MAISTQSMHWLKKIPRTLLELDQIPLMGTPPSFDWNTFSSLLGERFHLKDLKITPKGSYDWRSQEDLYSKLGKDLISFNLSIAPGNGVLYWIMSSKDLRSLMLLALDEKEENRELIEDPQFFEAFSQFLALETIDSIFKLNFDKELSINILEERSLPEETSLSLDIEIKIKERSIWGRLVFSKAFQQEWKERYQERPLDLTVAGSINLTCHLEVGHVSLAPHTWQQVKPGDFLLLDSCSIDPRENLKKVKLTVHGIPLFAGELVEDGIQLLEFSEYDERNFMSQNEGFNGEHANDSE